jgi:hypothetical protein
MFSWPKFESVSFPKEEVEGLGLSSKYVGDLAVGGVPREFFSLKARTSVSVTETPWGAAVWFGDMGVDKICLEPDSGHVIRFSTRTNERIFINTSLRQFRETVRAVIGRFPFHAEDATFEEIESAAGDVGKIVSDIDPPAMAPDLYWSTLVDGIVMSDFDLEVLGLSGKNPA